jgi:hypothetical protein
MISIDFGCVALTDVPALGGTAELTALLAGCCHTDVEDVGDGAAGIANVDDRDERSRATASSSSRISAAD